MVWEEGRQIISVQPVSCAVELGVLPLGSFADGRKQAVWHIYSIACHVEWPQPFVASSEGYHQQSRLCTAVLCAVTDRQSQAESAGGLHIQQGPQQLSDLISAVWLILDKGIVDAP